jgi:hypothetical protein
MDQAMIFAARSALLATWMGISTFAAAVVERAQNQRSVDNSMRKIVGMTAAAALVASGAASAASRGSSIGLREAGNALDSIENAQFVWGGHSYCWYDDGWHGPGW